MAIVDKISDVRMKKYIYIFLGLVGIIKLLEEKITLISAGNPEDSLKSLSIGKTDIVILDIEHYTKYKNVIFKEILNNEWF